MQESILQSWRINLIWIVSLLLHRWLWIWMVFWSCPFLRCILDTFRFIFLKCLLIFYYIPFFLGWLFNVGSKIKSMPLHPRLLSVCGKTWISRSGLRYSRVGLSGVELKLGARCLYKKISDQALEIHFLGAQKLTKIGTISAWITCPYWITCPHCLGQLEKKAHQFWQAKRKHKFWH